MVAFVVIVVMMVGGVEGVYRERGMFFCWCSLTVGNLFVCVCVYDGVMVQGVLVSMCFSAFG